LFITEKDDALFETIDSPVFRFEDVFSIYILETPFLHRNCGNPRFAVLLIVNFEKEEHQDNGEQG
jgi:hypothetical protein